MSAVVEMPRHHPVPSTPRAPSRATQRGRDARGRFLSLVEPARRSAPVLFVVSEMADFLKAGGLGDVAAALPRALRHRCDMRVLIPGYPSVLAGMQFLRLVGTISGRAGLPDCDLALGRQADGLPVYVLLNAALYERAGSPYVDASGQEWADNAVRFATLSHAAARIAAGQGDPDWQPCLLHLNDWPAALAAAYVRADNCDVPSVLTIHNLAYQGIFNRSHAAQLGLQGSTLEALDFHGQLSFLRAGIACATRINTVSLRYARQITTVADGCGLHALLAQRHAEGHLSGIVNGIDESWNPADDHHLRARFCARRCAGRAENAAAVRAAFGLRDAAGPLFAVVSRLVHQKGLDLTCEVAPQIVAAGGQLAIIGSGEPAVESQVRELGRRYPGQVGVWIGFEEALARKMFGGAEFLLMPSRFEPCGLSQMYAQRFGCLPIAHATGGLVDTVDDGVTGFLFHGACIDALRGCVERAMRTFSMPALMRAMRRAAMLRPAGWERAGRQYLDLYQQMGVAA